MKSQRVTVQSRVTGEQVLADVILCPDCKTEPTALEPTLWVVFQVRPGHMHLQCYYCDSVFCDGRCSQ